MRVKKTKIKNLKDRADRLFSLKIREFGDCELEGLDQIVCKGNLSCAHIFTRRNMRLRYDLNNALCACWGHHFYYTHHPEEWMLLIYDNFPSCFDYVVDHRNEIVKANVQFFEDKIKELTKNEN